MARPLKALKHLGGGLPITKKAFNTADAQRTEALQKTFNKPVVGAGHQGNSNLPVIREVDTSHDMNFQALISMGMQLGTRKYKMGKVQILVSPPDTRVGQAGWHMSISHPDRYPTWDEVASAWYQLVPDADNRVGQMALPKKADYISIHNYCFQVHEQVE